MTYTAFEVSIDDGVAQVVMSRPESLNSMDASFWNEVREIFVGFDDDPTVRAVVLSSTGKHFTAGMDLKFFGGLTSASNVDQGRQREQLRRLVLDFQDCFSAIERCRVPVLAAVQGGCIGGAVDLASAADCRYGTEDAFFCIQEINIGMTADVGTFPRLCHLIPQGMVRELAYKADGVGKDHHLAIAERTATQP